MAEPIPQQQISESTSTVTTLDEDSQEPPTLRVKLRKPKSKKSVQWTTETVDNEHMNKKKSKCCCIYEKPKTHFDDSSSEESSDDECEHCHGHVEKKKTKSDQSTSENQSSVSNNQMEICPTQVETITEDTKHKTAKIVLKRDDGNQTPTQ